MNKSNLIEIVMKESDLSLTKSTHIVNSLLDFIADTVSNGESVTLRNFGVFESRQARARKVHNFNRGGMIEVPSIMRPYFRPGKAFKKAVKK